MVKMVQNGSEWWKFVRKNENNEDGEDCEAGEAGEDGEEGEDSENGDNGDNGENVSKWWAQLQPCLWCHASSD